MSALTSTSSFLHSPISRFPFSSYSQILPANSSLKIILYPLKIPRIRASSNELNIETEQEDAQESDSDQGSVKESKILGGTTPEFDKDLKKARPFSTSWFQFIFEESGFSFFSMMYACICVKRLHVHSCCFDLCWEIHRCLPSHGNGKKWGYN